MINRCVAYAMLVLAVMVTRNVIKMMIAMISVWREADDDGGNEGG